MVEAAFIGDRPYTKWRVWFLSFHYTRYESSHPKMRQIMNETELFVTEQEIQDYFVYYRNSLTNLCLHGLLAKKCNKCESNYIQNYHVVISVFIVRNGLALPSRQIFATPLILLPLPPLYTLSVRDFCRKWLLMFSQSCDVGQKESR